MVKRQIFYIAVGNDAHQFIVLVNHRQPADTVFVQNRFHIHQRIIGSERYGIGNHTVFVPFYHFHFGSLLFDAHIFVNKSDAALTRYSNCHIRLGNRVHRRTNNGNVQVNVGSQTGF